MLKLDIKFTITEDASQTFTTATSVSNCQCYVPHEQWSLDNDIMPPRGVCQSMILA